MDEPCSALDPIATLKIEELMRELAKDYTIIIVTHNMQQAARVSDYHCLFHHGSRPRRLPGGIWAYRPDLHQSPKKSPKTTSPGVSVRIITPEE